MRRHSRMLAGLLIVLGSLVLARATLVVPDADDRLLDRASAVFRGTVKELTSFVDPADNQIYTWVIFRVDEVFKGTLPPSVNLKHRGGTVERRGEVDGFAPQFAVGEERLVFVSRAADGSLYSALGAASSFLLKPSDAAKTAATPQSMAAESWLGRLRRESLGGPLAGADVTDQAMEPATLARPKDFHKLSFSAATNLLVGGDGIPSRFILPDRGESIPYYIDADYLPAGMTQTQAVNAVKNALAAWTNVTSVRYLFAGIQSFGQAAPNVTTADGALRIQLHDHYNYLAGSGGEILGRGGHAWIIPQGPTAGWTSGGNVAGNDFHRASRGYVVLQHTNVTMQNLSTFTEVLTHEIGHTIGLDHSSVNASEPNPLLKQAIMYYAVHADGRAAAVTNWDINVSRQVHPPTNTPPYCYDRFLDIVTSPTRPLNVPGVNSAQIRGYDLQSTNLTIATADPTANNGTFSVTSNTVTFVPSAFFGDSARLDPASGQYYDHVYARYSDGVNASPFVKVTVLSFNADSYSEGVPDSWRTTYFGSANPAAGPNRHVNNDFDGDGFSNLQEYLLASNPADPFSNLRVTSFSTTNLQWQAKPYEVYELLASTNLNSWSRTINPTVPINSPASITGFTNGGPRQFFRVLRVP